jgi:hypothetical protein
VDWRDANIFHAHKGVLKNVSDANTPLEREVQKVRIVLLAEMILNLQDVPGFNACASRMLNRDLIESTYAELEIARLLYTQSTVSNPNHRFAKLREKDWRIFSEDPSVAPPERTSFNGMPPHWRRLFFYPNDRHPAARFGLSPIALSLIGPPWHSVGRNT